MSRIGKITREQALEIRRRYAAGEVGITSLAVEYHVSARTIHTVVKSTHHTVQDLEPIPTRKRALRGGWPS